MITDDIATQIKKAKNIVIIGHVMPDGDDISSVLSLFLGLKQIGKNVVPLIESLP